MNLEKQTIKLTVRKIVKRQQGCGSLLYDLYMTVPTINPKSMKVKSSFLKNLMVCVTAKHLLPTTDGYTLVENLKVGATILFSLDLICK
jgi:hypothetical protein